MSNSRLTGTRFDTAAEAVRWHGAIQAQEYALAKWSIGQRATNLFDVDLDRALVEGSVVRTHVLRPTWHFVAPEDARWLLALTGPRVQQANAGRYRELGLDQATRARCEALIASALRDGNRLTREEIARVLENEGIETSGQRLPYILMHCELEAAICSGGLRDRQHTYALLDDRVPGDHRFDRDEALVELARRYLASHGPATVKDLRWWSGLTAADVNNALQLLGSEVRSETVEGLTLWSLASDMSSRRGRSGAQLLSPYDELIVGFGESRYFGDPRKAAARAAWRDRSLPNGVVLLNGSIAGHWRRKMERLLVRVEILVYETLKPVEVQTLDKAAGRMGRFIGREARVEVRAP